MPDAEASRKRQIEIVRRPFGGGAVCSMAFVRCSVRGWVHFRRRRSLSRCRGASALGICG
jgi:hypothetical protein